MMMAETNKTSTTKHTTVLLQETIATLDVKPGKTYVDLTLGGAGHFRELWQQLKGIGTLIGFDQDSLALERLAAELLETGFVKTDVTGTNHVQSYNQGKLTILLVNSNFTELGKILAEIGVRQVNGIIADLGLSADQYADEDKGFSYTNEGKLDMRLDSQLSVTAADLLNALYKKELIDLFTKLGEVNFAHKLANAIIRERQLKPITTTSELKQIVQKIVPSGSRTGTNKHPEAKVFQALRIAVNDELGNLRKLLPQALETLAPEGVLSIISFHSGEDRIIKDFFREKVEAQQAEYIFKIKKPTETEVTLNKRSHSAKLRSIRKIK